MTERFAILALCVIAPFGFGWAQAHNDKIEETYDATRDRTTVRLLPIKIAGKKDSYHSLHMSPSFSYSGRRFKQPAIIDFELQTVVKGRLSTDLYVVFVIDGEKIFLSSNRSAIKQPVRGRTWKGERLVFRMPLETLQKLAIANYAAVKFHTTLFEFTPSQKEALKKFAARAAS